MYNNVPTYWSAWITFAVVVVFIETQKGAGSRGQWLDKTDFILKKNFINDI